MNETEKAIVAAGGIEAAKKKAAELRAEAERLRLASDEKDREASRISNEYYKSANQAMFLEVEIERAERKPTPVKEMVAEWLKQNGYDGLYNEDGDCACLIDDLVPCDGPCDNCLSGYKHKCPPGHEFDYLVTASPLPPKSFDQGV